MDELSITITPETKEIIDHYLAKRKYKAKKANPKKGEDHSYDRNKVKIIFKV